VILTKWVFTYKLDKEGYLVKYKARIVVRGDLQPRTDEETYAATLAARIFRLLIVITAYFDLDAYQFNALNAFTNAHLKTKVWI
jgi:Reverse transcriptase (RNA-dependent DNA polymerase)